MDECCICNSAMGEDEDNTSFECERCEGTQQSHSGCILRALLGGRYAAGTCLTCAAPAATTVSTLQCRSLEGVAKRGRSEWVAERFMATAEATDAEERGEQEDAAEEAEGEGENEQEVDGRGGGAHAADRGDEGDEADLEGGAARPG